MPITPNDSFNQRLGREFRGYAREEVNEFLDEVVADRTLRIKWLPPKRQLAEADAKTKNFEKLQESLNSLYLDC